MQTEDFQLTRVIMFLPWFIEFKKLVRRSNQSKQRALFLTSQDRVQKPRDFAYARFPRFAGVARVCSEF